MEADLSYSCWTHYLVVLYCDGYPFEGVKILFMFNDFTSVSFVEVNNLHHINDFTSMSSV